MAAGVLVDNFGRSLPVNDNSCATVKAATDVFHAGTWFANTCSTDPVIANTKITFTSSSGQAGLWKVVSITATPSVLPSTTSTTQCYNESSPFRLTLTEGAAYGSAIVGVWITAWVFKTLARSIMSGQPER